MKIQIAVLLMFLSFFTVLIGQEENIYIYHQATEGETFKSIGNIYGVHENDIRDANPNLQWTLKYGESVRIPYSKSLINNDIQKQIKNELSSDTLYYKVSPKETLWGISRKFNVTIDALIAANEVLKDGLKIGQKIIIPKGQFIIKQEVIKTDTNIHKTHIVKAGETMYSIAKHYRVRLDSLQSANPQIIDNQISIDEVLNIPTYQNINNYIEHKTESKEKISEIAHNYQVPVQDVKDVNSQFSKTVPEGNIVKIPVAPYQEQKVEHQSDIQYINIKDTITKTYCTGEWNTESVFKIALMMPFETDQMDYTTFKNITHQNSVSDYPFFEYFQFYQSALLALDELKNNNLHIELYVFDISDDGETLNQILKSDTLKNIDLIVGILYKNSFKKIAEYARIKGITLINVNSQRDEIIENYPNVVKMMPKSDNLSEAAISTLPNTLENINLMITRRKDSLFKEEERLLKLALSKKYSDPSFCETTLYNVEGYEIIKRLDKEKPNYIIFIGNNKAYIMNMMRLFDKQKKDYEIHIIGYPAWNEMTDLDVKHIQNLNTVFITSYLIDYEDAFVTNFIHKFRETYNAEPDYWAYQSYDIFSFFIEGLTKFGKDFMHCYEHIDYQPMTTKYLFETTSNTGYNNLYWNVYTIQDYKIIRLN